MIEETLERRDRRIRTVLADLGVAAPVRRNGAPIQAAAGGPSCRSARRVTPSTSRAGGHRTMLADLTQLKQKLDTVPLRRPIRQSIETTSGFGVRVDPFLGKVAFHTGIDFRGDTGDPARATAAGTVTSAGRDGGYGLMVEVDQADGLATRYAHLPLSASRSATRSSPAALWAASARPAARPAASALRDPHQGASRSTRSVFLRAAVASGSCGLTHLPVRRTVPAGRFPPRVGGTSAAGRRRQAQPFLGMMINDMGAAMTAALVLIGDRLGLYKALAAEPMTPGELAGRTGTSRALCARMALGAGRRRLCALRPGDQALLVRSGAGPGLRRRGRPAFLGGFGDIVQAVVP